MPFPRAFAAALVLAVLWPAAASGQVGLGLRLATVNGSEEAGTSDLRHTGALLRARMSPRTAVELAIDWRSETNDTSTLRTSDRPFQGSLLLYPFGTSLSPYLLGGVGWYYKRVEILGAEDEVLTSTSTHPFGYHGGFGAELRLGRRAAVHVDYRYTNIRFGDDDNPEDVESGGGFRVPGLGSVADALNLSHEGSMWTGGVTLYF